MLGLNVLICDSKCISTAGQQPKGTYTAKLQDEPREKKRGLQRSNSSPNIAKMMEDEGKQLPSIDRASKPIKRYAPHKLAHYL